MPHKTEGRVMKLAVLNNKNPVGLLKLIYYKILLNCTKKMFFLQTL